MCNIISVFGEIILCSC